MKARDRFLADCAEVWDQSDDRPVFVFGQPGGMVSLFSGPMTTHTVERWLCIHLGHADSKQLCRVVDQAVDSGIAREH